MDELVHQLLAANRRFATTFADAALRPQPRLRLAVLTCMDARLDPLRALGLDVGDAHVLRNAGGRASPDALRSLAVSAAVLGTRRVAVVHHTDCGLRSPPEAIQAAVAEACGATLEAEELLAFDDLEQSVRDDVATIRSSHLLPADVAVVGLVYAVETGRVRVVAAT